MKLILLFFVVIDSISIFGQSGYFDNNPIWEMTSDCAINTPVCIEYKEYNYYIKGDTLINTHLYKKLFIKGNQYFNWNSGLPIPAYCQGVFVFKDTVNPYAFIRDTLNKIFIYSNSTDSLLYDFNLSVGDTLPKTYNNGQDNIYVTSIDSILVGSDYRKVFMLSSNSVSQFLIEGIGHDNGFLEPFPPIFECGYTLWCFALGDSSYFPTTGSSCNLLLTNINDINKNKSISTYPNPANEYFNLNSFNQDCFPLMIEIYNPEGLRLILNKVVEVDQKIDVSNLNSGLYIFHVLFNDEIQKKKIVILK